MNIIPSISVMQDKKEHLYTVEKLIKYNISYVRCCVNKRPNQEFVETINSLKAIYYKKMGKNLKLMLDIAAPKDKIRVFGIPTENLTIQKDQIIYIRNNQDIYKNNNSICIEGSFDDINIEDVLIIGNGILLLQVKEKSREEIKTISLNSGVIKNNMEISGTSGFIKYTDIDIKDKCYSLVYELKPECIALSYVECLNDILISQEEIKKNSINYKPQIMSKIETIKAFENIDSIIDNSDSLMFARGCMGLNAGVKYLLYYQDVLLKKCKDKNKELYIASNILKTLKNNSFPTRSEICDAAYIIKSGYKNIIITDSGSCQSNAYDTYYYYLQQLFELYQDA